LGDTAGWLAGSEGFEIVMMLPRREISTLKMLKLPLFT
jgi:hypothetical protein